MNETQETNTRLDDRLVLITGASIGIGRAVAERCARAGARVIVCARTTEAVEETRAFLETLSPKAHLGWPLDVANSARVLELSRRAAAELGGIDGLVNCAGVIGPIGSISEVPLERLQETMAINFFGTVAMCQAFLPILRGHPRKKIVNFSGGGSTAPFPRYSAYAASKVAVVRFTENLAVEEAASALDVNCVAPGFVATRMHAETLKAGPGSAGADYYASTQKQLAEGGVPPEKAADLCAWLLSNGSDGISGKLLSAPWDPWTSAEFQERLRKDKDLGTLRRIDDKYFTHKRQGSA